VENTARLGILGGTFDPIHLGHLRAAEEIREDMRLDKVYLIPSASPPHKTAAPVSAFDHRLTMTRAAADLSPALETMDLEGQRAGLSYSIETLKEFRTLFGRDAALFFIVGTDAFLEIDTWKSYRALFDYAHFVIISRPGVQRQGLRTIFSELKLKREPHKSEDIYVAPSGNRVFLKTTTLMDISSTHIRERVGAGRSIRFLVPEPVRRHIEEKRLYVTHGDAG